jgi:hypothetical protein
MPPHCIMFDQIVKCSLQIAPSIRPPLSVEKKTEQGKNTLDRRVLVYYTTNTLVLNLSPGLGKSH